MHWYMVNTVVGKEKQAVTALQSKIKSLGKESSFTEVIVPEQKAIRIKDGVQKEVKELLFPGYILLKMELTPETQLLVKGVTNIKGFVTAGKNPSVFSDAEADKMLQRLNTVVMAPKDSLDFSEGEKVKIVAGPFNSFTGKVESVNGQKVKVLVEVFGRQTSVELTAKELLKEVASEKAKAKK